MTRRWTLLWALIAAVALVACETGVRWDRAERENARHIFQSLQAARNAADKVYDLPARWEPDGEEVQAVIQSLDDAIMHANLVRDSVLTKAHPQLATRFRGDYMRSLRQLRQFYRTGDLPGRQHPAQALGDFTEWFYGHQHEFRWWSGYRQDLGLER
jgi:hypothetical protein